MPPEYARQAPLTAASRSSVQPEFLNDSGRMGCWPASHQLVMAVYGWLYDQVTADRLKKQDGTPQTGGNRA